MSDVLSLPGSVAALAVALGAGLLIGLERERRKGQGPLRRAAGVRTFTVAALAGAVAQGLSVWVAVAVVVGVAGLAVAAHWRDRSDDPGLTTEVALITTVLIGMLAAQRPALAAGCAVVLAAVLASRERLHRFATQALSEQEWHDALLLSALALVLLPLLPAEPVGALGQMSPRQILALVIVILLMQALGHVARRLWGVRVGLALSGLLGGFVSSTATVSAMGALAREGPSARPWCVCAAVLSMVATWLQLWSLAWVVSPDWGQCLAPFVLWGAAWPLGLGLALWAWAHSSGRSPTVPPSGQVLRVREAAMVSAMLVMGAVVVNLARQWGGGSLMVGVALAALGDAHAPVASLLTLGSMGQLPDEAVFQGLLVALATNGVTRAGVAWVSGGRRYAGPVSAALAINLIWAAAWVWWPALRMR